MEFSTMYYWLVVLDRLHNLSCILTALCLVPVCMWIPALLEDDNFLRRGALVGTVFFFTFGLLAVFIPDKETMVIMYAGDKVQTILNSDKAQVVGDKAYRVLETAMDEYLKKNEKGKENDKH